MYAKKHRLFLLFLMAAVPNQAKLLLKHLTSEQRLALREVAINLLSGTYTLTAQQLKLLRKHKQFYRQLAKGRKIRLLQKALVLLLEVAKPVLEAL